MLSALLIRSPWIDKILDGSKTWEIRGTRTHKRERIALIQSGSGTVIGVADLVDAVGPLTKSQFVADARKIGLKKSEASRGLPYRRTFAWVLKNPRRLKKPVPYRHPYGSIIWVTLKPAVRDAVLRQLTTSRAFHSED